MSSIRTLITQKLGFWMRHFQNGKRAVYAKVVPTPLFFRGVFVKMQLSNVLSAAMIVVALSACSGMSHKKEAPMAANPASLYDRLGGKGAITAVVDDFIGNVAGDERINGRFGNTDIPKLKQNLWDQVCAATGGPCTYSGKDMKTAHTAMRIQDAGFGVVEDLIKTLNKFKVGKKEQDELLGAMGGMKKDIVNQ